MRCHFILITHLHKFFLSLFLLFMCVYKSIGSSVSYFLFVCPSIRRFTCQSVSIIFYMPIHPSVFCLSICLSLPLSLCVWLFIHWFISLLVSLSFFVYVFLCLSVSLLASSVYPPINSLVCLSLSLILSLFV